MAPKFFQLLTDLSSQRNQINALIESDANNLEAVTVSWLLFPVVLFALGTVTWLFFRRKEKKVMQTYKN